MLKVLTENLGWPTFFESIDTKRFFFHFLTKQKDDSLLELCWKVVMRKLSFRHHFSIKTLTSFLKAPTNWKWWSNNDFFHKKFETLRKDHLVWLMKKFCYTHYSLYQKSFTHVFIQLTKLRVLLHILLRTEHVKKFWNIIVIVVDFDYDISKFLNKTPPLDR